MAYWLFKLLLFAPAIKLMWRPWIEGKENVPARGAAILASNHLSYADTLALPAQIPRRMSFPAKAELFHGKTLGAKIVGWFLRTVGQVPIDRSGGRASTSSMSEVSRVLDEGRLLGIYPEGTRSPDGRMYKGKTGVARLVLEHNVPVIPVGAVGTHFVKGPFGIPIVRRPGMRVGKPMDFSRYADRPTDPQVLRWVTDEIMYQIQQLTGQEYVDVYASSVKKGSVSRLALEDRVMPRPGYGGQPPADASEASDAAAAGPAAGDGKELP